MALRPQIHPATEGTEDRRLRDRALMVRVRAGDPAAFEEIVQHYWSLLVRYVRRLVGDVDEAKDVVQEAFSRLWAHRLDWESSETGTVQSYLYYISRNVAIDELRRRRNRSACATRADYSQDRSPPTPVQLLDRAQLGEALERAIQALPERRREVFILAVLHNLSYAEIGQRLGTSVKTIANQMWGAISELRKQLRNEGFRI